MLALRKGMNYQTVLDVIAAKRAAIALDLAELKQDGVKVIDIDPNDLMSLELAGFMVCVETGVILAGPAQFVL